MTECLSRVNESIRQAFEKTKALQESIHMEPELSNAEAETREKVKSFLSDSTVEIKECKNSYGLVCDLVTGKDRPRIAFRGDMDALPIHEKTGLPYASQREGVMHACGHDFHTSILAGAAKALSEQRETLEVNLRFLFQPAEEDNPTGGARGMIEEGALSGCSAVFGMHLWPELQTGRVGTRPGPLFAASDRITIRIIGKSSHAAKPEAGIDSIVISGHILTAIQSAISRGISPFDQSVVTIGRIEGGTRYNVLPEETVLYGTVRNTSMEVRAKIRKNLEGIVKNTAEMFGGRGELEYVDGYPVLENDPFLTKSVCDLLRETKETGITLETLPNSSMVSEDFSLFAREVPGVFLLLGCTKPGTQADEVYPLHSPSFKADQDCIKTGLATFAALACNARNILTALGT